MTDFDSSYDSGGETTGENSYDSVDIGNDGVEVDTNVEVENDVEVTIPSGPEVGTEIDIAKETDSSIPIGDSNIDKSVIVDVDESGVSKSIEVNTEQVGKDTIGKNNFEGEEKINEYLDSLSEEAKGKQIEALGKMSIEERAVYAKNIENEPRITNAMKEVAQNNGAELQGLEYRIKTPSSTYEKMHDYDNATDIKDMNDIIRYTEIYSLDKLAEGTNASLEDLKSRGFEVERVKNTWDQENATYRGINVVLKDPEGQTFELQFHTQESFDLKNGELHELYEERRKLADDDPRAVEIDEKMIELSSKLERPKNIDEVKNI